MNRIEALKAIAGNLRDLVLDATPTAATATSMDFMQLIHPNAQQLMGRKAYIYSGAGAGQERIIGSLNPASRRISFDEAFTTTPSINSNVLILNDFYKWEYDYAINRMIGQARVQYLETKVATAQLVGTQYEYLIPSGFEYISLLRLVPSGSSDYESDDEVARIYELPPRYWSIIPNAGGSYLIRLDPRKISIDNASLDSEWINIIGQVKPDIAGTDNAVIIPDLEEYIISGASALLASQKIAENSEWRLKFQSFKADTNKLEDFIFSHRRGREVG